MNKDSQLKDKDGGDQVHDKACQEKPGKVRKQEATVRRFLLTKVKQFG
jgi:hypothetical protein